MPHPKYPKAQAQARAIATTLASALQKRTTVVEVATVAATQALLVAGYVQATTQAGPIRVVGVPPNSAIPGMRMYVQKLRPHVQSDYLFQAWAPALPPQALLGSPDAFVAYSGSRPAAASSQTFGANGVTNGVLDGGTNGAPVAMTISSGDPGVNTIGSSWPGWYWSFFFYISQAPTSTQPICLFDMSSITTTGSGPTAVNTLTTGGWRFMYDALGRISFGNYKGTSGGSGFQLPFLFTPYWTSTTSFAPHRLWFFTFSFGGNVYANGNLIGSWPSGMLPAKSMYDSNYALFLLGDCLGNNCAPQGSWISKAQVGYLNDGAGNAIDPYGAGVIPASDFQLVFTNQLVGSATATVRAVYMARENYVNALAYDSLNTVTNGYGNNSQRYHNSITSPTGSNNNWLYAEGAPTIGPY